MNYLWHNFKCLCDSQVKMSNTQLDACVWRSEEGVCALNINLGVVLVCSILATERSKRSKASTMLTAYFLDQKALMERNRILECQLNMAVKGDNLLINPQQ